VSFTFRTGVDQAIEASRPTCHPCKENDHGRCPTVLTKNDIIFSDFDCACFRRDVERHEEDFTERQENTYSSGYDYFNPATDLGPPTRGYYASQRREARRWGGVDY
jgi:hypothetical protein